MEPWHCPECGKQGPIYRCERCRNDPSASSLVSELKRLVEKLKGYQATSKAEARKAARTGDVVEQRSRQAEACTLNVCINEIEAALTQDSRTKP